MIYVTWMDSSCPHGRGLPCPHKQSLFLPCNNPHLGASLRYPKRISSHSSEQDGLYWQYSGEGWGRDAGGYIAVLPRVGHDCKQLVTSPLGFLPSKVPVWLGFKDFLQCPLSHTSLQCCSPLCPLGTWNALLFWVSRASRLCPSTSAQTYPIKGIIARRLQLDSFDVSRGGFPEGRQRTLQFPIPRLSTERSFI